MTIKIETDSSNSNIKSDSSPGIRTNSSASLINASTLLSYKIVNNKNDVLGNIKDIVFNLEKGNINYVILSFGSFLGIREKLMAIPLSALELDVEKKHFLLDMEKTKLDNPLIFDNDNWPDMTSSIWSSKVNEFFGLDLQPSAVAL